MTHLRQAHPPLDSDAGGVDLNASPFTSAVVFELGDNNAAHHLCETLWRRWDAVMQHGDAATLVSVGLPQAPRGVNEVLCTVEDWLDRRGVSLIRFHLDGRLYVLQRGGHVAPAGPHDFIQTN